jgi:RNA polymerase-associated protein CTR9
MQYVDLCSKSGEGGSAPVDAVQATPTNKPLRCIYATQSATTFVPSNTFSLSHYSTPSSERFWPCDVTQELPIQHTQQPSPTEHFTPSAAMAASQNANGLTNGHANGVEAARYTRFGDIPAVIDIPVRGEDGDEAVNLDLTELQDETDELCDLLGNENAAKNFWITIALAYVKQNKVDIAIDMIKRGLQAFERGKTEDRLGLLTCLVWLQLWRSRHTRRTRPENEGEDQRNKENFLQDATATLNDAMRLSPSYPPLSLARGVLCLLKAALLAGQPAGRVGGERAKQLADAAKAFDETLRHSNGRNMMALLGRARATYTMGRYADALQLYQQALERAPDMLDPDPRIGLGCCLWALGHKEHAHTAWDRSLELNPNSSIAHTLLGLYYLDKSSNFSTTDEEFGPLYKKAMTVHTQTAFKLNDMQPLTCATFGGYFLLRRNWANVDKLAKRAVEQTDTTAIMSDGWYLRARQAHYQDDIASAAECYNKSDLARGGDERGYLPAKFGAAQLRISNGDFDGAKFRLEKIVSQSRSPEAMTLLGILHAEDVFTAQANGNKEDKSTERRKAIALLEQVRAAWRDPKKKLSADAAVLLNLARLYENEAHDKSLACLLQVEELEIQGIPEEDRPEDIEDEAELKKAMRELISPQLLNNIGCFHYYGEKFALAREDFQTALNACVKMGDKDNSIDTDALVTTISFNLARTYEAENMDDEAKAVYTSLLQRHPDYTDASLRLTYIALNTDPKAGAAAMEQLIASDKSNLEIRSLYGWFINKTKKRTLALNEDAEQRHYKHTLQAFDKHDLYSLTGMGNLHLAVAREMPRATDQEKDKRSGVYRRAVEFFDKVLALDPRNAYAAQGMGIALVEDRKDSQNAIQIFSRARESIKDYSVHLNLGHVFVDVKQFGRSIENYEIALSRIKSTDPQLPTLLACLGRVWLLRGRTEQPAARLEAMKTSLAYSRRALEAAKGAKDEINHRFNVAFVQIQIAQLVNGLKEQQRTLADVETASKDLDEAIEAFSEIAKAPNPPFPAGDIEQRASMGRNTMKRQLATALEKQTEFEQSNAAKLDEARRKREAAQKAKEDEQARKKAEEDAHRAKIAEERQRMQEEDRQLIERRLEEDRAREEAEYTDDPETGDRKKREKRPKAKGGSGKRKKKGDVDSDDEGIVASDDDELFGDKPKKSKKKGRSARSSATPGVDGSDDEAAPKKKKRRLAARKDASAKSSKYKSADFIQDSSEDEDAGGATQTRGDSETPAAETPRADEDERMSDVGGEEEESVARPAQRKKAARVLDDDDEDEDEDGAAPVPAQDAVPAAGGDDDEE